MDGANQYKGLCLSELTFHHSKCFEADRTSPVVNNNSYIVFLNVIVLVNFHSESRFILKKQGQRDSGFTLPEVIKSFFVVF